MVHLKRLYVKRFSRVNRRLMGYRQSKKPTTDTTAKLMGRDVESHPKDAAAIIETMVRAKFATESVVARDSDGMR